jgi:hypothetical protein
VIHHVRGCGVFVGLCKFGDCDVRSRINGSVIQFFLDITVHWLLFRAVIAYEEGETDFNMALPKLSTKL